MHDDAAGSEHDDPEDPDTDDDETVTRGERGQPDPMPDVADADATCLAWAETGLWARQWKADAKAEPHVIRTIASLVRDFGDAATATWSREYARWVEANPARTKGRKRHDKALLRWASKAVERAKARGEDLRAAAPPPEADADAIKDLEREFGR